MRTLRCLWCRRGYSGDPDGYRFCDRCIGHLEELYERQRKVGVDVDLIELAESCLKEDAK